ncbi:prephenate dehydratase [Lipingzhangella sp. LS1_29]|uniref:Prephenate dehydratase n=1 Tax=Lipingzhangella rawalii TaxID=2055835 RepID=A0ABU2HDL2_9ACTN|nr:prephenate dehydratase [Lipingzhangella rawalii]MDS1272659.1 prephenate dehydratase [Lipingzhangella rawalii]
MSSPAAFLGPEGTFTDAALYVLRPDLTSEQRLACDGVEAVFEAVRSGAAAVGVVPLENSVEGGVTATTAELLNGDPLLITGEVTLDVRFSLVAREGTHLADVKHVVTHPHAQAQCRGWLGRTLPQAQTLPAASTAAAAQIVAEPGSGYDAAISAPIAGERYGLRELATDIGDRSAAATRFVLLSPPGPLPEPTGHDRTSLAAFLADDHPGALAELLNQFSVRDVNLTRLESRPTGDRLGNYCFVIDAEGHVVESRLGEALMGIRRSCRDVRFLGSYPRGDASVEIPTLLPRRTATDTDFHRAQEWLERIRAGGVS